MEGFAPPFEVNRKQETIGRFSNEVDAAIAYNKRAVDVFGEFAYVNVTE